MSDKSKGTVYVDMWERLSLVEVEIAVGIRFHSATFNLEEANQIELAPY